MRGEFNLESLSDILMVKKMDFADIKVLRHFSGSLLESRDDFIASFAVVFVERHDDVLVFLGDVAFQLVITLHLLDRARLVDSRLCLVVDRLTAERSQYLYNCWRTWWFLMTSLELRNTALLIVPRSLLAIILELYIRINKNISIYWSASLLKLSKGFGVWGLGRSEERRVGKEC